MDAKTKAKKQYSDRNRHIENQYADRESIAKMFGFSPNTLDRWRSEKRNFPYYIIGGSVRYNIKEIQGIVESGRVNAGDIQ